LPYELEIKQLLATVAGYGVILLFAFLYSLGGREDRHWYNRKWIRRYAGGILLPLGLIVISKIVGTFNPLSTVALVGYPFALSLGYGADTYLESIGRRFIYGFIFGAQAVWFLPYDPSLLAFSICLSVVSSLYLGIQNPVDSPSEEMGIAVLSTAVLPLMV